MNELYWISRLNIINNTSTVFFIISLIFTIVSTIGFYIAKGNIIFYKRKEDKYGGYKGEIFEWEGYKGIWKSVLSVFVPILILSSSVRIFVPTTEEAFIIYGVGGTIDYVKSNPTTKQLPDKCINVLDKWVDSWTIEKDDSIRH